MKKSGSTLLEAIRDSLVHAALFNSGDAVAPAAVVWTDADGEWKPIVTRLQELMPELLILGPFDPDRRTGPAIWMRCVIEGVLETPLLTQGLVPVLYLPGVSRQVLRSPEDCPEDLKPLVELQYRGAVWTQVNGKDWTVEAFLVSENGGLGLEVARDQKTRHSMLGALDALATTPITMLHGHKLEAEDFDKLMVGDTVRDLLLWMGDAAGCRKEWDAGRWSAFKSRCLEEYEFDPERDGDIMAGERLGMHQGEWAEVWRRFAESPFLYSGVPELLKRAKPAALLFDREPWPDENEKDEASLRQILKGLGKQTPADARKTILELNAQHGARRNWVWARMGLSPLAGALEHLKTLAETTATPLKGETPDLMAKGYVEGAYRADDAVLRAIASVKAADDQESVCAAIRALYLGWLDDTARNFQAAVAKAPLPDLANLNDRLVTADPGDCLLFTDGLRYDVAQRLIGKARERQIEAEEGYRWAAVPSVTSTAKSAVTPAAGAVMGEKAESDFYPVMADSMKQANASCVREWIADEGYQVLQGLDAGNAAVENARGWSESGEFDSLGHKLQGKMATQIDGQVDLLLDRIVHLLDSGWRRVRVVTDHGWLFVPGGLMSLPMKKYLTECRWSRCAVIKPGAPTDVPTAGWFWDPSQTIAFAPGAYCFVAGTDFAHGGLSLQECLTPDVVFTKNADGADVFVVFDSVQWLGLRCRVTIKPAVSGLAVGLRGKANDPKSAICPPKIIDEQGRAGLLVEDEALIGSATSVVVFDSTGRILCKQATMVGGEA